MKIPFNPKRKLDEMKLERPEPAPITGEALTRIADEVGLTTAINKNKKPPARPPEEKTR